MRDFNKFSSPTNLGSTLATLVTTRSFFEQATKVPVNAFEPMKGIEVNTNLGKGTRRRVPQAIIENNQYGVQGHLSHLRSADD